MTAPEVGKAARSYALPVVLGVLAVGIAINFALLIPTLRKQSLQAADGQKARVTQCAREPVIRKLVLAGQHYHLLTAADVADFRRTAPHCP